MKTIDLNRGWRLEPRDFNEGLARKAYRRDYRVPDDALSVDLPKIAQAALFESGRLPDPYVGTNSEAYKPAETKEWWYHRDFETPARAADERLFLRLEGVTYRAEVWINGLMVGRVEGMFRLDEFDITEALAPSGTNRIAVRCRTQEDAIKDDRGSPIRGKVRNQGVVAQAMYRWNWCPHLVGVGIWRPVSLVVRRPVEILDSRVRTVAVHTQAGEETVPAEAPAELELSWEVTNSSSQAATTQIEYEIVGETFSSQTTSGRIEVTLAAGETRRIYANVSLPIAKLWWCNGLGDAHLYRLRSRAARQTDDIDEAHETTFGVREVRFVPNDDAEWVTQVSGHTARPWTMIHPLYNWILSLNSRRVFLKGSNWVHADVLLRLDRERYERVLLPAKIGGLNFLRVWGGSLAETDDFYDLCDRLGILCWQEFWLACENYPALDRDLLARCARDTVRRLYNRPSLVFYSGGNEFEPDNLENKPAVDTLARVVEEEDGHREFRRSSPYKGDKHGGLVPTPTGMRNKYLDILPGDKRQVLFRSETAVGRSAPMFGTLERFLPDAWPLDEKLFRHFFGVPSEFLSFANEYAADDAFDAAVIANHFAHVRVLQVNLEYCRSQMFRCGGHLNWQYSVPWPCLHREIVDWWGVPKPAFYHYANACKAMALFVDVERYLWNPGETIALPTYLVNDLGPERSLKCRVDVMDANGRTLHTWQQTTDVGANQSLPLAAAAFTVPRDLGGKSLMIIARIERGGETLFQYVYWVAVSHHVHDEEALRLDGEWRRDDASVLVLPGNDMRLRDDGFESIVQKQTERDFEQAAEDRAGGVGGAGVVTYRRSFTLPAALRRKPLEFFSPGFEAGFEIVINGRSLGGRPFRGSSLDLGAMAHVPWRKAAADSGIDPDTDYRFFSDPITLPKLEPCFLDIPEGLLKDGENEIVLKLKTDCQKIVSQSMWLRERTPNREEVATHLRRGVLFRDLREMPSTDVDAVVRDGQIVVHNRGEVPALMVLLDVEATVGGAAEPIALRDNALMLLPAEQRTIRTLDGRDLPHGCRVTLRGWNVDKRAIDAQPVAEASVHA